VRMNDSSKEYRIEVDQAACGPKTGCRYTQNGGLLTLDLELIGEQRRIVLK